MVPGSPVGAIVLLLNPFRKSVYGKKALGQGWDVVEKYISGQKGREKTDVIGGEREERRGERYSYENADTLPVVVIDEEKEKALKTGYITLHDKLFKGVMCASRK